MLHFLIEPAYEELQRTLPLKANVISVTLKNFFWDFSKQNINSIEAPGQVSPMPGMPSFKGADKMVDYFIKLGYGYIVYPPLNQLIIITAFQNGMLV